MNVTIESKELYILVLLKPGEGGERSLADALMPFIGDAKRFFVFDFSAIHKLDFNSLSQLESAAQTALKAGRKLAFCGVNQTIKTVVEVTDLLKNAVFFENEKELAYNLKKAVSRKTGTDFSNLKAKRERAPGLRRLKITSVFSVLILASALACVFLLQRQDSKQNALIIRLDKLERSIGAIHAYLDSLQGRMIAQHQEDMLMRELDRSSREPLQSDIKNKILRK